MTKRRIIKQLATALAVILLAFLGSSVSGTGTLSIPEVGQAAKPGFYKVTKVSDGDTFDVMMAGKNETIRMIGIDTPETKDPRRAVQCFGKAASDKTNELLADKQVRLEADPINGDRDKYHRLLRYVYLEDGTLLNQLLVQQGYAFAYTVFPNSKLEQFRGWEREAREANRGLWSGCEVSDQKDRRRTQDQ